MQVPTDKYVLQDYRDDLRTPGAPQTIDTDTAVVPVKIVGAGLWKPNSRQRLRYAQVTFDATSRQQQIITVSPTTDAYFIYAFGGNNNAAAATVYLFDAVSGAAPALATAGTPLFDNSANIGWLFFEATAGDFKELAPQMPIKLINGLRSVSGGGGLAGYFWVFWIEENRQ